MKVLYYPGCTLRTHAADLDRCARECAAALGFELCEIDNWQCCGGAFTDAADEIVTKLAAVRALRTARDAGLPLITVCSACHNVLKRTNLAMRDPGFAGKVNAYLSQDGDGAAPYNGEAQVIHYLEFLRDQIGFGTVRQKVVRPLSGQKIAGYYGCLLLRPGKAMGFDDPENPRILEDFIAALGAEPVIWPDRNECCGGYLAVEDPAGSAERSRVVIAGAAGHGAGKIVTACPLCRYNLEKESGGLPVVYFTRLLADALGVAQS